MQIDYSRPRRPLLRRPCPRRTAGVPPPVAAGLHGGRPGPVRTLGRPPGRPRTSSRRYIATDVHRVVPLHRELDVVCTCGLVMVGTDVITSRGHRDLRTWRIAEAPYTVSHGQDRGERLGVVCPYCGSGTLPESYEEALRDRAKHRCADQASLLTTDELREALFAWPGTGSA